MRSRTDLEAAGLDPSLTTGPLIHLVRRLVGRAPGPFLQQHGIVFVAWRQPCERAARALRDVRTAGRETERTRLLERRLSRHRRFHAPFRDQNAELVARPRRALRAVLRFD